MRRQLKQDTARLDILYRHYKTTIYQGASKVVKTVVTADNCDASKSLKT